MNKTLPKQIELWKMSYDPFNFYGNENWFREIIQDEDLLQITHIARDRVIDFGFYGDGKYRVSVVADADWDDPVEMIEVAELSSVNGILGRLIVKYS